MARHEDYPDNVLRGDPQAFEDPLSNYDPPEYASPMERELCEGEISQLIQMTPFATVSPDDTIEVAVGKMASDDSFSLMVIDNGRLLGVLSERDVLEQCAEHYEQCKGKTLREVMTPEPAVVHADDPPAKAINLMATGGFRRVPVVDENDQVVGVVGPKRITAYLTSQFG